MIKKVIRSLSVLLVLVNLLLFAKRRVSGRKFNCEIGAENENLSSRYCGNEA